VTHRAGPLVLPDPPLSAGAIRLRPWAEEDAPALAAAWSDPEVARWTGVPDPADEAAARRWIAGTPQLRARGLSIDLVVEQAGAVVGEVGLVPRAPRGTGPAAYELGWWVGPAWRGEGLASAAVRRLADWALDPAGLGGHEVAAVCAVANPAAGAVARQGGLEPTDHPAPEGHVVWLRAGPAPAPGTLHP
jgi:RimJ/RimL family protein N-acetyltransferase